MKKACAEPWWSTAEGRSQTQKTSGTRENRPKSEVRPCETTTVRRESLPETSVASHLGAESETPIVKRPQWGPAGRMRPVVNSFDIFDTLIARRCIDAMRIHEIVEQKVAYPGYAKIRRSAEEAIAADDYTLEDIYRKIGERQGIEASILEAMKLAEIETELENVIPIADMMAKVRDGDILVSDMYLGDVIIQRLLARAGFEKRVGIYVSPHGKATKSVWPKLLANLCIARHWGDNRESDLTGPRAFGIPTRHVSISAPLQAETWLMGIGLRDIALLCREGRLHEPAADPVARQLLDIQATLNFPMLLLASIPLAHLIRAKSFKRVLFSSRDGELWLKLFTVIAKAIGLDCEVEYFYTSRMARRFPSTHYLEYARDRLGEATLVVDLCGTGWSLAHLSQSAGIDGCSIFLLAQYPKMEMYEKWSPTPQGCDYHSIIGPENAPIGNANLELANQVPYGSMVDVRRIDGATVPIVDGDQRSERSLALVRRQNEIFSTLVDGLGRVDVKSLMESDDQLAAQAVGALARQITVEGILPATFFAEHAEEDAAVYDRLCDGAKEVTREPSE